VEGMALLSGQGKGNSDRTSICHLIADFLHSDGDKGRVCILRVGYT
jgi:hypothetical protein